MKLIRDFLFARFARVGAERRPRTITVPPPRAVGVVVVDAACAPRLVDFHRRVPLRPTFAEPPSKRC